MAGYSQGGMAQAGPITEDLSGTTTITGGLLWESHYVSEGRDNLNDTGIQTTTLDVNLGKFNLSLWNGWGYDSGYDELQISPSMEFEAGDFDVYFMFNHKRFFEEGQSENEIGSGISTNNLPYNMFINLDWYYLFENDGSFYLVSTGTHLNPVKNLTLEPTIELGFNDNYITDGHDGANHASLQLNGEYELPGQLKIYSYIRYNIAIESEPGIYPGDESLRNFFWGGIGLEIEF